MLGLASDASEPGADALLRACVDNLIETWDSAGQLMLDEARTFPVDQAIIETPLVSAAIARFRALSDGATPSAGVTEAAREAGREFGNAVRSSADG